MQPAGDYKSSTRRSAAITFRQACGYLHSRRASPPVGRYQLYCLVTGTQVWTTCPMLLRSFAPSRIWTHDLSIASPTLYPLRHRAYTTICWVHSSGPQEKWSWENCTSAEMATSEQGRGQNDFAFIVRFVRFNLQIVYINWLYFNTFLF